MIFESDTWIVVGKFISAAVSALSGIAALFGTYTKPNTEFPGKSNLTSKGHVLAVIIALSSGTTAYTSYLESANNAEAATQNQLLMKEAVANSADAVRSFERLFYPIEKVQLNLTFTISFQGTDHNLAQMIQTQYEKEHQEIAAKLPGGLFNHPKFCNLKLQPLDTDREPLSLREVMDEYINPRFFRISMWTGEQRPNIDQEGFRSLLFQNLTSGPAAGSVYGYPADPPEPFIRPDHFAENCRYGFGENDNEIDASFDLTLEGDGIKFVQGKVSAKDFEGGLIAVYTTNNFVDDASIDFTVPSGMRGTVKIKEAVISTYTGYEIQLPSMIWSSSSKEYVTIFTAELPDSIVNSAEGAKP